MTELVSIIIPTYNRCDLIIDTIHSVLAQTYENIEVLIVDDGSTDDTEKRIITIKDSRVRYFRLHHFGYPAPARNHGIKMARGNYIAFLDSDDVWFPRKIETQMRDFELNPNLLAIASNFVYFQGDRKPVLKIKNDQIVSFDDILAHNIIVNSSVVFKREIVEKVGFLNESATFKSVEDCDYWLRILRWQDRSILVLRQPLVKYRIHQANISQQQQALAPLTEIKRLLQVYKQYMQDPQVKVENAIKSKLAYARFYLKSQQIGLRPMAFIQAFKDPDIKPIYKLKLALTLLKGVKRALLKYI